MKYLLDTHTFIWLDANPGKLSANARLLCADRTNQLMLSIASIWEIQIKIQIGKLILPTSLANIITAQQASNEVQLLSIELSHVLELALLPDHHRDPFDRMLVAQARIEGAHLIRGAFQLIAEEE
jgi:PIN domain nuclease of toxin-antitoxin system